MKDFMKRLPVYNGKFDKPVIEIAFHHFMAGTKIYTKEGREITTQEGFINAVLYDPEIKITEKQIYKIRDDYNKDYPVTPNTYRELKQQIYELRNINSNNEKIIENQAKRARPSLTRRKEYYHNAKYVVELFNKQGRVLWSGEMVTSKDRLIQLVEGTRLFSKHTIRKLFA